MTRASPYSGEPAANRYLWRSNQPIFCQMVESAPSMRLPRVSTRVFAGSWKRRVGALRRANRSAPAGGWRLMQSLREPRLRRAGSHHAERSGAQAISVPQARWTSRARKPSALQAPVKRKLQKAGNHGDPIARLDPGMRNRPSAPPSAASRLDHSSGNTLSWWSQAANFGVARSRLGVRVFDVGRARLQIPARSVSRRCFRLRRINRAYRENCGVICFIVVSPKNVTNK